MSARMKTAITRLLGPCCHAILRLARRYSTESNLRSCTSVGARVVCGPDLTVVNLGRIKIGDDVELSSDVLLSAYKSGSLAIGDRCFVGRNVMMVAENGSIEIGNDTLIADDVAVRASNHGTTADAKIREQPNIVKNVGIGSDVWIGRGVAVLAGAQIADGCIIAANSVVHGPTEPYTIYGGVPVRKIRAREPGSAAAPNAAGRQ